MTSKERKLIERDVQTVIGTTLLDDGQADCLADYLDWNEQQPPEVRRAFMQLLIKKLRERSAALEKERNRVIGPNLLD